jgi:hypothetical protein
MSFTRFHDDPYRIQKQLEETTHTGRYQLDTPGPGMNLPFMEDPHIRLQKWGSNLRTNTTTIESDLRGLTRKLNNDLTKINDHKLQAVQSNQPTYNNQNPFVEESRSSHPAWSYKGLEQNRWEKPLLNPVHDLEPSFPHQIQTRILEKDHFEPKIPVVSNMQNYYLTGPSICIAGNEDGCHGTHYRPTPKQIDIE